ncbi:hypothetical protein [Maribacter sp. Asnod2-G09]
MSYSAPARNERWQTLSTNKKKLEDFYVEQFRHDLFTACTNMGYSLEETH